MSVWEALRCYVVTPEGGDHVAVSNAAVAGGATAVQLRAPELTQARRRAAALEIAAVCRRQRVLFIVNDDVDTAVLVPDAGLHVGQGDLDRLGTTVGELRGRLGAGRVLGVSVATPQQAVEAASAGADYLGVTVHGTGTKADAEPLGVDALAELVRASTLPVVAIGGLHHGNADEALAAGAAGVAVVSAVAGAEDPVDATRRLRHIVDAALLGE